jgi:uncharacterized membrane protein
LFVALGPFAVRYSDEARMYGLAAMLAVAATYVLVRIATSKYSSYKSWLLYAIIIAAGLYTHYYTLFIIPAHIVYLGWVRGGLLPVLRDKKWWFGNLLAAAMFVPWLPSAFAQMTRVGAGFWIPPVNGETVPNTFMQFLAFIPSWAYSGWIAGILITLFVMATVRTFITSKRSRTGIILLSSWLVLPLAIVMLVSIVRPVYYDRYFIYCAVAMYLLMAVIVAQYDWLKKHRVFQGDKCEELHEGIWYRFAIDGRDPESGPDAGHLGEGAWQPWYEHRRCQEIAKPPFFIAEHGQ